MVETKIYLLTSKSKLSEYIIWFFLIYTVFITRNVISEEIAFFQQERKYKYVKI